MRYIWRCLVLFLVLSAPIAAEVNIPPLATRVTDLTNTLSGEQQRQLEARLQAFEATKGSQVAVLIVPTTQPETIEQYSIRVVEQWKLGRKKVDDGVLLLIAKNDRTVRIEVGYGLEGVLTDAMSKRIIAQIIVPKFKEGNFYGGISNAVEHIVHTIEGEALPLPKSKSQRDTDGNLSSFFTIGFIVVIVLGSLLRKIFGSFFASVIVGGAVGILAWLIVGPLIVAIIAGIIAFIFSLFSSNHGGWSAGGLGGRGNWSGGGGFSGGGGSFGGGGASGGW